MCKLLKIRQAWKSIVHAARHNYSVGQKSMHPVFRNRVWELSVTSPWRATDCEHCVEITQPDGVGAIHISNARKKEGLVTPAETMERTKAECPEDTDVESVSCGDFKGHTAEYVDWHAGSYWKKWFVACRSDLLFITYTCKRGEEELEIAQVAALLASLRSTA